MAKQIITEEESLLKRQARRRLIGAIALTLLVVVLLPMVLDREPPAPMQDIELKIPDKDTAGEFVPKMVLPPLSANNNAAASQPVSAPVIAPLLDAAKPASAVVVQPKVEAKPGLETKPEIIVKSEIVAKPKLEQKIKPEEAKPKVAAKPAEKPHSGFIVQVGAFANAEAAKKLQEKLHKQGYPSYTEKTGNKTRVRIGSYASHAEAEKVRRKLEIQGMQPDVLNLN